MMNSAIVIALTIACSNGVWANTIPTTIPPTTVPPTTVPDTTVPDTTVLDTTVPDTTVPDTTVPTTTPNTSPPQPVCYIDGITLTFGQTYEDKHAGNEMCRVYMCDNPPDSYSHTACYDVTTDRCVTFYSTQIIDGRERVCEPYTENGGPGWVAQVCYTDSIDLTVADGQTYEDKHAGDDMCRIYVCTNPPSFAESYTECYDSTIDKCVTSGSYQIKDGNLRWCMGNEWWLMGGYPTQPTSPTPTPTTTPPPTTTPLGCYLNGVQYQYGEIPNSGGCFCDYSGYMVCP